MTGVFIGLYGAGSVGALTFVLSFVLGSRGWYRDPIALNLVAMGAVLGALLGMVVVSWAVGMLPWWMWIGGLGSLDAIIWWQVVLLWSRQRRDRKEGSSS